MNSNEIILPCRLSYANIWEARQSMEGDKMQYSCCLLIPKTDAATIDATHQSTVTVLVFAQRFSRIVPGTERPTSVQIVPGPRNRTSASIPYIGRVRIDPRNESITNGVCEFTLVRTIRGCQEFRIQDSVCHAQRHSGIVGGFAGPQIQPSAAYHFAQTLRVGSTDSFTGHEL